MVRRDGGFTYLGLMIFLTIVGLVGAATLKADALLRRAAAEEELLETGAAFAAALKSYAEATPRGQPPQPPTLQELLKDPRFPNVRRHLRKLFVDPITGTTDWGIVWANPGAQRGVLAVYSLSRSKPFKQANFDSRFQNLDGKEHLSDWKFAATGQGVAQGQVGQACQPGQPSQPGLFLAAGPAGQAPGQGPRGVPADGAAPADPPSLFPGRGGQPRPSPAERPPPADTSAEPPPEAPKPADGEPKLEGGEQPETQAPVTPAQAGA
jgi:type II secretory pathway pseudopilin PulG